MVIIGSSSVDSIANGPQEEASATPSDTVGTNQQVRGNEIHHNDHIQILISPRIIRPSLHLLSREARVDYITICVPLYNAALKGDWEAASGIIEVYPTVVRAGITRAWETALHIAAAARRTHFVEELVRKMNPDDLTLQDQTGNTALCYAASAGAMGIAEVMVIKNPALPSVRGSHRVTPLYMATSFGHHEMVWFLYKHTRDEDLEDEDRIEILNTCISTRLFDVAIDLLKYHPKLALARDGNGDTALHVLARNPSAFTMGNNTSIWTIFTNSIPGIKVGQDPSLRHHQALELVRILWKHVLQLDNSEISELIRSPTRLLFVAAESGNTTFLVELIRAYPDLLWKVDEHSRSIFHTAVLHRHADIFNLIYEIGSIKDLLTSYRDEKGNNMLHLAARVAPTSQLQTISGAALQMQRELLWFKEVEKIMQPSYTEKENLDGKKPRALFTEEHENLIKKGEKWMKNTATSCMVVATLIATVVFAAAFTVPGGNNQNTGYPLLLKKAPFMIFAISDAIALVTSSTSILMFLSILTSRYSENDFIEALPAKLMMGLTTLFISITTMMIAFTATFFVIYHNELKWVPIPVAVLACLPTILFATLKYPLLTDVISSTYNSKYLFRPNKRMLY